MLTKINCGYLITLNQNLEIFTNYAIIIEDDKILDILPQDLADSAYQNVNHTLNLKNHLVMPGLINAHTHTPATFMRGFADDLPLEIWLKQHIWPTENKILSPEYIYDAALYSINEMLLNGITCFNDMFFFSKNIASAVADSKIRANIGTHIFDYATPWAESANDYINQALDLYEQYKDHKLINASLNPHSPYTVSDATFIKVKNLAEKYNLKICCHLHETPTEIEKSLKEYGIRPVQRLNNLGILNANFQAIHMTQCNDAEMELFKEKDVKVIHCPESNLKLASGICPTPKLLELGVTVGLGTDGAASNNDLDILSEMRTAALIAKVSTNNPTAIPAIEAIKMATINNAKALGLDDKIGSIEKNKQADIIAINMAELNTSPLYDINSQLVYAANSYQITDVFVAGNHLVRNRELKYITKNKLIEIAEKWKQQIITL